MSRGMYSTKSLYKQFRVRGLETAVEFRRRMKKKSTGFILQVNRSNNYEYVYDNNIIVKYFKTKMSATEWYKNSKLIRMTNLEFLNYSYSLE